MGKIMAINLELAKRVRDVSSPRESREDVIEYYQEKYPGQKTLKNGQVQYEWKKKIVDAELALNPNAKRASLNKRYQKEKGVERYLKGKPKPEVQAQYKALGEKLPPKPPAGITVTGTVCVRYQDNPCEPRTFTVTLEGGEMRVLLESFDMQTIINKYMMIDVDDAEPTISECPCNGDDCECDFEITAIEE